MPVDRQSIAAMKGSIFILTALLLFGCSEKNSSTLPRKPVVFVSIMPQMGLAKLLAGDLVDIYPLIGEGRSPHAYAPTGRQLAQLAEADALLTIGEPFEKQLLKKIAPLYPALLIIPTQARIKLRAMPHDHHGELCAHNHGGTDPHVWLSPENLSILAKNIATALETIDPKNSKTYRENYDSLAGRLSRLDVDIREQLQPYAGSRFYVFHPSFGYFADAYGLEQIPIELDGKSPSPKQLTRLIEQANADGVSIIFVQKQFPISSAEAIANALGGTVVQLDPLAEDNIANLRLIADSIANSLKK